MAHLSKEIEQKMKGKEVWITNYEGHEIKVVNKNHITLYIDGVEASKNKSLIFTQIFLHAAIPDTDKIVIARVYQKDQYLTCNFIIGDIAPVQYGYQHKDGKVELLTDDELKEYHEFLKKDYDEAIFLTLIN